MSYLNFDKKALVNLEYSLNREILSTSRNGGYLSTTIVGCNTRKYHGLLVCPIDEFGGHNHVLLSSLDETLIQRDKSFNLGIHRFPGNYEPRGHKYIVEFEYEPTQAIIYSVGGMLFKKEFLLKHNDNQLLIRYTLLEAHSPTKLRLKPFLAFRNIHDLSKANLYANTKYNNIENGIETKLYQNYPLLRLQVSKKNEFVHTPDWYYNIEYLEEINRGYDAHEDLFVPGFFEMPIKKGESIVFSASLKKEKTGNLLKSFDTWLAKRMPKNNFVNCLKNSASQFIVETGETTEIVAGYPWLGCWGLDMFIALPGLTLASLDKPELCKKILDDASKNLKNGYFPKSKEGIFSIYDSVDIPLWYVWAIQEYDKYTNGNSNVWKLYGKILKDIISAYINGNNVVVGMHDNGLIWQHEMAKALTWMDAIVSGKPVTQRAGYAVEINALWYNVICYTLNLARTNKSYVYAKQLEGIKNLIEDNFLKVFWNEEEQHLADYVDENGQNMQVRPNQIFATSLQYSPIDDQTKAKILHIVQRELLTEKGIRTLSPKDFNYKGSCFGNQVLRNNSHHQGTAMPWLLGAYVEANFNLHGKGFLAKAKYIVSKFEDDITNYGIASIGEMFDGNPPQMPRGSISQAWNVAELLRIIKMIEFVENK